MIEGSDARTDRRRNELLSCVEHQAGAAATVAAHQGWATGHRPRAIECESHYDGKWLLRTSDGTAVRGAVR